MCGAAGTCLSAQSSICQNLHAGDQNGQFVLVECNLLEGWLSEVPKLVHSENYNKWDVEEIHQCDTGGSLNYIPYFS